MWESMAGGRYVLRTTRGYVAVDVLRGAIMATAGLGIRSRAGIDVRAVIESEGLPPLEEK
jgi:hypothetical protein